MKARVVQLVDFVLPVPVSELCRAEDSGPQSGSTLSRGHSKGPIEVPVTVVSGFQQARKKSLY